MKILPFKNVRVDVEVDKEMERRAEGFESRNDVLRRLMGMPPRRKGNVGRPKAKVKK